MGIWDHGDMGYWGYGILGIWDNGDMGYWGYGILGRTLSRLARIRLIRPGGDPSYIHLLGKNGYPVYVDTRVPGILP